MSQPFSRVPQHQLPNLCGACSLSSALYLLGIDATQLQIARGAGRPVSALVEGLDEQEIKRAAESLGASLQFVAVTDKSQGASFAAQLRTHLETGQPSIILVWDFAHWVAVLAFHDGRFIVMDGLDRDRCFSRWSERHLLRQAWNNDDDEQPSAEPPQYFGILLRRADGRPPRFRATEAFIRLCEVGSEQTANEFAADLAEMARRASPEADSASEGPAVAEIMAAHTDSIVGAVAHWTAAKTRTANAREIHELFDDYLTVAAATGLRLSGGANIPNFVAQLTTVLCTYAWLGEL